MRMFTYRRAFLNVFLFGLVTLAGVTSEAIAQSTRRNLVLPSGITQAVTLSQNWTDDEATWFYNVAQGSKLIPYAWFVNLEQPDSDKLFRDSDHIQALGYLARKPEPSENPDGLPIGFVKDGDHLGLTCAACHTGQIRFQGKAWLIDGAPTLGDFAKLQIRLVESLDKTATTPAKFERFANRILGSGASAAEKVELKQRLVEVRNFRKSYNERDLPRAGAAPFGPGRVDAFGAIMNEVTSTFAQLPANHHPANAPVSYPFLWDAPQHDRVQWNGAAENTDSLAAVLPLGTKHIGALGRNAGEVLGVFGKVDAVHPSLLGGYSSSVDKDNLIQIEETLRKLWSPQWPTELGAIVEADRVRGQQLFRDHCAKCHDDTFDRTAADRHVEAKMDAVGTDPMMASNFATRRAKTGVFAGRAIKLPNLLQRFGPEAAISDMLVHTVQRVVIGPNLATLTPNLLIATAPQYVIHAELKLSDDRQLAGGFTQLDFDDTGKKVRQFRIRKGLVLKEAKEQLLHDDSSFDDLGKFFSRDGTESSFNLATLPKSKLRSSAAGTELSFEDAPIAVSFQYKGRPLNGIWATAPFLHNGSVPNLDELLKAPAKRLTKFKVGSHEFDPDRVGFRIDQGEVEFDTSLLGNSNTGHEYDREFTEQERKQLIAYMKSL